MGMYLNPGNEAFASVCSGRYVDKSGLIGLINRGIGTDSRLCCISRPRRFGKSIAAQMLCAYYDKSCDSHALFDSLSIAGDETYEKHLNRYDVIFVDMTQVLGEGGKEGFLPFLKEKITEELSQAYPGLPRDSAFSATLLHAVSYIGNKFIMIVDEWDAPIRECPEMAGNYLAFLRTLFKSSSSTDRTFAAAYMTGILPIKKDGSQSAISNFEEFTMLKPWKFAEYVGFTEAEVEGLCRENGADFKRMKRWYDGYTLKNTGSVYNPNSVMKAIKYGDFDSYWVESSAAEGLMGYISKGYRGLSKTIAELIGGVEVLLESTGFANDLESFRGKDDVLTLLVHLGYLAYEEEKGTVRIPNEEIRKEFSRSIHSVHHAETERRLRESERLIEDTIRMDAEAVAAQIEKVHAEETSPLHYNNEQALRSVIKLAYYTYRDYYMQWEELPAGSGYADVAYLPKRDTSEHYPALVVELKWNGTAEGAIQQIKNRHYPKALEGYGGEILLVAVNYDKTAPPGQRKHSCRIERFVK